jgi:hypothetical protein
VAGSSTSTSRASLTTLSGHYAYYGITGNGHALDRFLQEFGRLWRKGLNRRSWHGRLTCEKFVRLTERYLLPHPVLFTVFTVVQRRHSPRSRMPESGTSRSVGTVGE